MPKVLRIINRFNLGGPTYNVSYLTKYMAPDYETLLVGGMNDKSEACSDYIVQKLGIHAIKISEMMRSINGYNDVVAYEKIKSIIKRYKPDIVHTHASKAGVLGRQAAISCGVPVIVHTFHGHIFNSYFNKYVTATFKRIEQYYAKRTSAIVAISDIQKYELSEVYNIAPAEKFRVIPLGFDLNRFQENKAMKRDAFRKQYDIADDEIAVSIVGRLVPVKNHRMFIDSIKNVKSKTNRKVRGVIVGDGDLRNGLLEYANLHGLTCSTPEHIVPNSDLIFTSWIKDADYVFAGSEISALTSLNEGTPVSIIESQAANVPVVSTIVGGIRDVVVEGKTALLSPTQNVDAFSENLLMLVENDEMRKKMSEDGWIFVRDKFHYTRLVNDMKNLYDELLANKGR
ncbi:MAG: glycosyltransferase [Bacteroidales bacterium]|nr:glycosyltransferase [Bacteroidales bacterium]